MASRTRAPRGGTTYQAGRTSVWVPVLIGVVIVPAACGRAETPISTAPRASETPGSGGGSTEDVVTMRMGVTGGTFDAQAPHLIESINRLSSGRLRIEHADEWDIIGSQKDAEQQIIEAVAAGDLDLGRVGTRSLTAMGVTDFDALIAPMLIDSY